MRPPVFSLRGQPSLGAWRLLRHRTLGTRQAAVPVAATVVAVVGVSTIRVVV